jgi:hypothetical protein
MLFVLFALFMLYAILLSCVLPRRSICRQNGSNPVAGRQQPILYLKSGDGQAAGEWNSSFFNQVQKQAQRLFEWPVVAGKYKKPVVITYGQYSKTEWDDSLKHAPWMVAVDSYAETFGMWHVEARRAGVPVFALNKYSVNSFGDKGGRRMDWDSPVSLEDQFKQFLDNLPMYDTFQDLIDNQLDIASCSKRLMRWRAFHAQRQRSNSTGDTYNEVPSTLAAAPSKAASAAPVKAAIAPPFTSRTK